MGRFHSPPNPFDDGGRDAVSLGIDTSRSHQLDGVNILKVVAPPHRLPLRVLVDGLPLRWETAVLLRRRVGETIAR